jgi:PleD family two-component response regulator
MKKLLIIMKDKFSRGKISLLLESVGYQVFEAKNEVEGIIIAGQERPDMILCEVFKKNIDGFILLSVLRGNSISTNIPFVFLTSLSSIEFLREISNLEFTRFLKIPFTSNELLATIKRNLDIKLIYETSNLSF